MRELDNYEALKDGDLMCRSCVNYIDSQDGTVRCDFEHFGNTKEKKAKLYMPVLFDCLDFEKRK